MANPFAMTGSYPVRTTKDVEFYVDGENAFTAIAQAIENAKSYVYITCAYVNLNFRLRPPLTEQLQDLCNRVANSGVRVALLFWQPLKADDKPDLSMAGTVSEAAQAALAAQAPKIMARWDIAKTAGIYPQFIGCHHQKTFVIDGQTAFVGGINMTQDYWDTCAHAPHDDRRVSYDIVDPKDRAERVAAALPLHDVFARLTGPAVADVEANFVERWNGATIRYGADLVPCPPSSDSGHRTQIQILRTIAPDAYPHTAAGEKSIKEAVLNLLAAAEQNVYFENQYFFDDDVVAAIRAAGERGVRVVGLLARAPDAGQFVGSVERLLEERSEVMFQWTRFNSILRRQVQLYSPMTSGAVTYKDIYVHSKTMIVDDRYVLAGSANISFTSMDFHSEMCVLIDDAQHALDLRKRLWSEHLCVPAPALPEAFDAGADIWLQYGVRNVTDRGKAPLQSRVMPLQLDDDDA